MKAPILQKEHRHQDACKKEWEIWRRKCSSSVCAVKNTCSVICYPTPSIFYITTAVKGSTRRNNTNSHTDHPSINDTNSTSTDRSFNTPTQRNRRISKSVCYSLHCYQIKSKSHSQNNQLLFILLFFVIPRLLYCKKRINQVFSYLFQLFYSISAI